MIGVGLLEEEIIPLLSPSEDSSFLVSVEEPTTALEVEFFEQDCRTTSMQRMLKACSWLMDIEQPPRTTFGSAGRIFKPMIDGLLTL